MNVAIIPARAGSKRIPNKNIKPFHGKPMISYAIEAAKACSLFDQVIVSTDSPEIKDVALRCGAEVPFVRPAELADDYTGTTPVIQHAIEWLASHRAMPTHVCCIYPTVPLLAPSDITDAYETLLREGNKRFAFSVARYAYPVKRALTYDGEGNVSMLFSGQGKTRSQDLDEVFHDAGQFYWGEAEAFLENIPMFSQYALPIFLPRYRVMDIDTVEDWDEAELLFGLLKEKYPGSIQ